MDPGRRRDAWPPAGSLVRQMRAILARMELVSAGTTQSYRSSGGESDQVLPATGEPNPPHLLWRRQFELAEDDDARRSTIAAALDALEQLTGRATRDSRPAGESDEDLDERIIAVGEGWSVKDTATHCRCLERRVVRARQSLGRRVDDGKPLDGAGQRTRLEKLEEAADLRARNPGMTVRQIALSVGLPKSTVADHLGRAA